MQMKKTETAYQTAVRLQRKFGKAAAEKLCWQMVAMSSTLREKARYSQAARVLA
jgi:hypothetical protein